MTIDATLKQPGRGLGTMNPALIDLLDASGQRRLNDVEVHRIAQGADLDALLAQAARLRDAGHGDVLSYSRKVFIPLTHLCRDVCHYCTFATTPRKGQRAYLWPEQVLAVARAGERAGCHEALFTLGDKPELRYAVAREELAELGHATTLEYLAQMCEMLLRETTLLPHVNPGVMTREEIAMLRRVSVSQGIMLENISERLGEKGGAHHGSPDKAPALRMQTMRDAGELNVPFTTGILIGIGETRDERIDSLLAIRELHEAHGHIQEVIVQNFRAKVATKMARTAEPDLADLQWTLAMARIIFGPRMNLQAPPNLSLQSYSKLVAAGLNDWGGVSPVTPDHVNPEMPWPEIAKLRSNTEAAGKVLVERLAIYPAYCSDVATWQDAALAPRVLGAVDAQGFARTDDWSPGQAGAVPQVADGVVANARAPAANLQRILDAACAGATLSEPDIVALFQARGAQFDAVCAAADELRRSSVGDTVRYVVNRNINYTNVCSFRCHFCAFSKGKGHDSLRGTPYDLGLDEVVRRTEEAWRRGATEVCMQGGIHPDYTGETYLALCRAVKRAVPQMHVHAFSPLEVWHGAMTLKTSVDDFVQRLRDAGLGTLPGTAAEILDDEVRNIICPDKLNTAQWLDVIEASHRAGFRTTATIMFGHVDRYEHWARHLLRVRELQLRTGGFTEFVPLPFVHMEAPMYLRGKSRKGPTYRETVLMHAVARLALHPVIPNVQVSWVKLGEQGVRACLRAGANDLGGTLMNESISRAAGTCHGQEMAPQQMDELIASIGRVAQQRSTLY
ncbi:MAG: 5-amino-6-(D-ribitylamino)uracil--L-tyrosine 4-hydroxyphenyl transferase CofH, partial [Burkholderiaceae bacterium]